MEKSKKHVWEDAPSTELVHWQAGQPGGGTWSTRQAQM